MMHSQKWQQRGMRRLAEEKVLVALLAGECSIQELEKGLEHNRRTIYRAIGRLEGFVKKQRRGRYALTPPGEVLAQKAQEYMELKELLEKHKPFWLSHELQAIPEPLLLELGALRNSHIISTGVTPDRAIKTITQAFENAKERIIGISPIVTLEWARAVVKQADRGIKISLITTEEVLKMQKEGEFRKYSPVNHENIDLMINNDIKLAFMSNMESVALALFNDRGLDFQNILVSKDPKAVEWGKRLFRYYKKRSSCL
jgi:predicted transcriptional regulator